MTKPWDVAASDQRKAILGGAVALLTALLSALQDGLAGNEIAAVVVAAAIGYLTVFTTENRPTPKRRAEGGFFTITKGDGQGRVYHERFPRQGEGGGISGDMILNVFVGVVLAALALWALRQLVG